MSFSSLPAKNSTLAQWRIEQSFPRTLTQAQGDAVEEVQELPLSFPDFTEAALPPKVLAPQWLRKTLPIVVYGGAWEEKWGAPEGGMWSDGLHVWVAESALRIARQTLLTQPSGASIPLWDSMKALNMGSISGKDSVLPSHRTWPEVRADIQGMPGGAEWLASLPEREWGHAEVQAFQSSPSFPSTPQEIAWWAEELKKPLTEALAFPPGSDPFTASSAVCLRQVMGLWPLVERSLRRNDPEATVAWVRASEVVHQGPEWLRERWALLTVSLGESVLHDKADHLQAAAAIASKRLVYADWMVEALRCRDELRQNFNGVQMYRNKRGFRELRDGEEPSSLAVAMGKPWEEFLMDTWFTKEDLHRWFDVSIPGESPWVKSAQSWSCVRNGAGFEFLAERGAPLNVQVEGTLRNGRVVQNAPLCIAASTLSGDELVSAIEVMLAHGADPCFANASKNTTLSSSFALAIVKNVAAARLLLAAGGDIHQREKSEEDHKILDEGGRIDFFTGATPLHTLMARAPAFIRKSGEVEKAQAVAEVEALLRLFIEAGADVNATTATGLTPLHAAARMADDMWPVMTGLMSELIKEGADPHACLKNGRTVLAHASSCSNNSPRGSNEVVKWLIQNVVWDVQVEGRAALAIAVRPEIRQILEPWISQDMSSRLESSLPPVETKSAGHRSRM